MILHQLIGLNYYHYVVGVEVKSVEQCDIFRLRWADFGCPPPYIHSRFAKNSESSLNATSYKQVHLLHLDIISFSKFIRSHLGCKNPLFLQHIWCPIKYAK